MKSTGRKDLLVNGLKAAVAALIIWAVATGRITIQDAEKAVEIGERTSDIVDKSFPNEVTE